MIYLSGYTGRTKNGHFLQSMSMPMLRCNGFYQNVWKIYKTKDSDAVFSVAKVNSRSCSLFAVARPSVWRL